jgi:hypothetical protein
MDLLILIIIFVVILAVCTHPTREVIVVPKV